VAANRKHSNRITLSLVFNHLLAYIKHVGYIGYTAAVHSTCRRRLWCRTITCVCCLAPRCSAGSAV